MLSLPEYAPASAPAHIATPAAWVPRELSTPGAAVAARPLRVVSELAPLFEVSQGAGIPDAILEPARAAAEASGYAAGWASGTEEARLVTEATATRLRVEQDSESAARRADVLRALSALQSAADDLERRAVPDGAQFERLIVSSAFDIAEALVGVTLRDDDTRGATALAHALELTPAGAPVSVSVCPRDYAVLTTNGALVAQSGHTLQLIADPTLSPGDAVATCGATTIDARLATSLARVRAVLAR